jgi:hypothetical protein
MLSEILLNIQNTNIRTKCVTVVEYIARWVEIYVKLDDKNICLNQLYVRIVTFIDFRLY